MAAAGALVQSDPAGIRKLHKSKSYAKIDGSMALAMALGQRAQKILPCQRAYGMTQS